LQTFAAAEHCSIRRLADGHSPAGANFNQSVANRRTPMSLTDTSVEFARGSKKSGRVQNWLLVLSVIAIAGLAFYGSLYHRGYNEQMQVNELLRSQLIAAGAQHNGGDFYEMATPYTNPDGRSFELVFDLRGTKLTLRTPSTNFKPNVGLDPELDMIKMEVIRLTSATTPIKLGDSGYTFRYEGGYPIWGPSMQTVHGKWHQNLLFAEEGKLTGLQITARGLPEHPTGYYPYP
jgi:hypothetical protein